MKKCTVCKKHKPLSEFYKCSKCGDGKQTICKECGRKKSKNFMKKNPNDRKKRFLKRFEDYKKTLKCSICGEDRHYVLDFHHRNGLDKTSTISRLKQNGNWDKLMKEIEKCDILCANCHREVHYKNKSSYTKKSIRSVVKS